MRNNTQATGHKKSNVIRNIPAFVQSYLKGNSGQWALKHDKPMAHAFAAAIAMRLLHLFEELNKLGTTIAAK